MPVRRMLCLARSADPVVRAFIIVPEHNLSSSGPGGGPVAEYETVRSSVMLHRTLEETARVIGERTIFGDGQGVGIG